MPGQHMRDADYSDMEFQLREIFYEILFAPIAREIAAVNPQRMELANAPQDALRAAIERGLVQYGHGIFSGQFSAPVSSALRTLGATFDKRKKTYLLAAAQVPAWVSASSAVYQNRAVAAHAAALRKLDEIQTNLTAIVNDNKVKAAGTVSRISDGFKASAKSLEVVPEITAASKQRLADQYSDNMELWIKNFTEDMIGELREDVEENAMQGYRFDKLIDKIRDRSSVSANKAKFLARQETALFMSQYRRERFSEAGVTRYRWSTSRDGRVRDTHKNLDGTVQFYSQPPIVDVRTGRRANPGADFNCRCVDLPILSAEGSTSELPASKEKTYA